MRGAERDRHGESRAAANFAFSSNRSAVKLHDLLDEGQPDAGAFEASSLRSFDPVKSIEQFGQFRRRNAGPGVSDRQLRGSADLTKFDLDRAFEREFEGVGKKVEDNLLPHVAIDEDRLRKGWRVDVKLQPGSVGRGPER
jgi:hypothetical protein